LTGHPIFEVELKFNMISLKSRHNFVDVYFMFKLLNNFTDNPELLQRISLNVTQIATRNVRSFYIVTQVKIYYFPVVSQRIKKITDRKTGK